MNNLTTINNQSIQSKIHTIRDMQVMLDRDLAELYGVETKDVNRAVKNNLDKFPDGYIIALSKEEKKELVKKFHQFEKLKHSTRNLNSIDENQTKEEQLSLIEESNILLEKVIDIEPTRKIQDDETEDFMAESILKKLNTLESKLIKYNDGEIELEISIENETIWLIAEDIASLFGVQRPAIVKHIGNIYKDEELLQIATCSILEQVAKDGKKRKVNYYNLDIR